MNSKVIVLSDETTGAVVNVSSNNGLVMNGNITGHSGLYQNVFVKNDLTVSGNAIIKTSSGAGVSISGFLNIDIINSKSSGGLMILVGDSSNISGLIMNDDGEGTFTGKLTTNAGFGCNGKTA